MEKYLRYKGEFFSIAGVLWRVEIWQDADEAYPVIGRLDFPADAPLVIEWNEVDKLEPVQSSKATLVIVSRVDRQYKDLYTVEIGSIRMDVYRNDSLYWSGTLVTELYEEPFSYEKEYEVTLTFSDFAVLDRMSFKDIGYKSLHDIVEGSLNDSFIHYGKLHEYISTSCEGVVASDMLLTQTCVNCGNFYDEDGEAMTCREVLEETLRPFALHLVQRGGNIYLYDLNAIQTAFVLQKIKWQRSDAVLGVDETYKNVKVTFSPYNKTDLMKQEMITENLVPLASDLLVRQNYSVDSNNNMNAPEGFNITLFQSELSPKNLIIHKNAKPFKINSIFSGYEGEGLAWIVKIGVDKNSHYNEVLKNSLFTNYETLMKINKTINVPNVLIKSNDKKKQMLLRLRMKILLDVRYNPFEQAGEYNEAGDYENMKYKIRSVHIPFRMRIRDANGNVVKHFANVRYKTEDGIFEGGEQRWEEGDYPIGEDRPYLSNRPYAVLSYYNPPREDKLTKLEYSSGWLENYQCVRYPHYSTVHPYDIMGTGEFISIPEGVEGTIEVEIGTGIFNRASTGYYNSDIAQYPVFEGFADRVRWLLYQTPVLDVVNGYGKDVETKDMDYISWINAAAKEELEIETILGNGGDAGVTGLGVLLRKEDRKPVLKFSRAGVTDYIEKLLIGTVYSQYAKRKNVLTGTVDLLPGFGIYTDEHEPGNYMVANDKQDVIADESELKLLQIEPDNFEGVNYEESI